MPIEGGLNVGASVIGGVTVDAVRGQENPPLGWFSPSYKGTVPLTTVRAHAKGKKATLVWAIWFDDGWKTRALEWADDIYSARPMPLVSKLFDRAHRVISTEHWRTGTKC